MRVVLFQHIKIILICFTSQGSSQLNHCFLEICFFLLKVTLPLVSYIYLQCSWVVFLSIFLIYPVENWWAFWIFGYMFFISSWKTLTLPHSTSHGFLELQVGICEIFSCYHLCPSVSSYFLPVYVSVLHCAYLSVLSPSSLVLISAGSNQFLKQPIKFFSSIALFIYRSSMWFIFKLF